MCCPDDNLSVIAALRVLRLAEMPSVSCCVDCRKITNVGSYLEGENPNRTC